VRAPKGAPWAEQLLPIDRARPWLRRRRSLTRTTSRGHRSAPNGWSTPTYLVCELFGGAVPRSSESVDLGQWTQNRRWCNASPGDPDESATRYWASKAPRRASGRSSIQAGPGTVFLPAAEVYLLTRQRPVRDCHANSRLNRFGIPRNATT